MLRGRPISGTFSEAVFRSIASSEGFVGRVYGDQIAVPTVGYGYALLVDTQPGSGAFYVPLPLSVLNTDFNSVHQFTALEWSMLETIAGALNRGDTGTARRIIDTRDDGLLDFLISETQGRAVFENTVVRVVDPAIPDDVQNGLAGTHELVALYSLAYNCPVCVDRTVEDAIRVGDRVGVWFEIAYRSNPPSNGAARADLQVRRFAEAEEFGLYSEGSQPASEAEARAVIQFLDDNRAFMENRLANIGYSEQQLQAIIDAHYAAALDFLDGRNNPPVAEAIFAGWTVPSGDALDANRAWRLSDPDGNDQIRGVVVWDSNTAQSSAHFSVPARVGELWVWRGSWQLESGTEIPAERYVFLSIPQFDSLEIAGGTQPGTDHLWVIPYDGTTYGTNWAGVTITTTGGTVLQVAGVGDDVPPVPGPVSPNSSIATPGDDVLLGGPGRLADTIFGLAGDDDISGFGGPDNLHGGPGDDVLGGGQGRDHLYGGTGSDLLRGGAGRDVLVGGAGNDSLIGGRGPDNLNGGPGIDTAIFSQARALYDITLDEVSGRITINHIRGTGSDGRDSLRNIEIFQFDGERLSLDDLFDTEPNPDPEPSPGPQPNPNPGDDAQPPPPPPGGFATTELANLIDDGSSVVA